MRHIGATATMPTSEPALPLPSAVDKQVAEEYPRGYLWDDRYPVPGTMEMEVAEWVGCQMQIWSRLHKAVLQAHFDRTYLQLQHRQ